MLADSRRVVVQCWQWMGRRLCRSRRTCGKYWTRCDLVVAGILVLHAVLGVTYSLVIPMGEGHDEWAHFAYVRHIVTEGRLPDPGERLVPECRFDETHQPPAYYLIGAFATSWVDMSDGLRPITNVHLSQIGGGRNAFAHTEAERWPYEGSVLGLHVLRLVSVLMGTLTVLATYLIARELLPSRRMLVRAATALLGFMPQLIYMGSIANNDIAVTMFATFAAVGLVRVAIRGYSVSGLLFLFVGMAGAVLSKMNSLGLIPVAVVVLVAAEGRRKTVAGRGKRALLCMLGLTAVVAGPLAWVTRSVVTYGDSAIGQPSQAAVLLGQGQEAAVRVGESQVATGLHPLHWEVLAQAPAYAFRTFWAVFGWGNVPIDDWIYLALAALCVLALLGCVLGLLRRRGSHARSGWIALVLMIPCTLLLPAVYGVLSGSLESAFQGRYLGLLAPVVGLLIVVGLAQLTPLRVTPVALSALALGMFVLAAVAPFRYIRPAYALPPRVTEAEAAEYAPVHATFGDFVELVGYRVKDRVADAASGVRVTLVWRVLARTRRNGTLRVRLCSEERTLGEVERYPGRGSLATAMWHPGEMFAEEVTIPVKDVEQGGECGWIEVSYVRGDRAPIQDAQGRPLGNVLRLTQVRVASQMPQVAVSDREFRFGTDLGLLGGQVSVSGETQRRVLALDLKWVARGVPTEDYAISLQLRDAANAIVAQIDREPSNGMCPPSLWQEGEAVEERYELSLPAAVAPGTYSIYLCVYDPATLQRLGVRAAGAEDELPADELLLVTVRAMAGPELQLVSVCPAIRAVTQE